MEQTCCFVSPLNYKEKTMKSVNFDFQYGGKSFSELNKKTVKTDYGYEYTLDDGIVIKQHITTYSEFDAVFSVLYFENPTDKPSEKISDLYDCNEKFWFNPQTTEQARKSKKSSVRITKMTGTITGWDYPIDEIISGNEFALSDDYILTPELARLSDNNKSRRYYTNKEGRSSSGIVPIFDLNDEEKGVIIAVGWSGNWQADFNNENDFISIKTGLRNNSFTLNPNESLRTSSILLMSYQNEVGNVKFRRLVKRYFSPESIKKRGGVTEFETFGNMPSEMMIRKVKQVAEAGIDFDFHWVDAGWYGYEDLPIERRIDNWNRYLGDYVIYKKIHPNNFVDVTECEQKYNMPLKLWVEIERYENKTRLVQQHPDWFWTIDEWHSIINLGNKDAKEYTINLLIGLVEQLKIQSFKLDFNTNPDVCWYPNGEENDTCDRELRYINGLYQVWDGVQERYPDLILDTCATGGKRFDIEAIRRSINPCRSDYVCLSNADADVVQVHNNLSFYIPYVGCFVRTINDVYHFRSCYCSCFGSAYNSFDYNELSDTDLKWLNKMQKEYKSLQEYFCEDFYSLGATGYDKSSWVVWQYDRPDQQDGILMAFRREKSACRTSVFDLKNIDINSEYSFTDIDDTVETKITGKQLKECGFTITLDAPRSSKIIKYKRK